jgi:hypothetical protein
VLGKEEEPPRGRTNELEHEVNDQNGQTPPSLWTFHLFDADTPREVMDAVTRCPGCNSGSLVRPLGGDEKTPGASPLMSAEVSHEPECPVGLAWWGAVES